VQKAYDLLESGNWKVEKVTSANDTISTTTRTIGKVYKLTAKVNYSPKKLLQELFYNIETVPEWNPTLLESKIIRVSEILFLLAFDQFAASNVIYLNWKMHRHFKNKIYKVA
jgi:hypothetical protein